MSISNVIIKGISLSDKQMTAALRPLPGAGFSKADFAKALVKQGLAAGHDGDFVRRLMQHLKQSGLIDYDASAQIWGLTDLGRIRVGKTLSLPSVGSVPHWVDRLAAASRLAISIFVCLMLIAALVTLNASFAWELGREAQHFRWSFVIGLMALDLMRPLLVAAGFTFAAQKRGFVAATAFVIGFALSPLSVLSSTTILSSSVLLGAEMNTDNATRTATLETLRAEHERKLAEVERIQMAWATECARGGCGPIAAELEAEFTVLANEAQVILNRIVTLTEVATDRSELLARMVITFEQLGVFGADRQIWLPLFLAISMELGALFGPALLLRWHL